jgi:tetratricopeptide (TPR) repeat protein
MEMRNWAVAVGVSLLVGLTAAGHAWADAAEDAYDEGVRLMQQGQQHEAIAAFDKAIRLNPRSAEAYNGRGITYHELAQYERAIKDYDAAIRLNPQFADAYFNRGNAYSDFGQHERAIKDYDEAIRLQPTYSGAYYNRSLASMLLARGDTDADARAYVDLKGWKDERVQYMAIFGHFGDRRVRRDIEARKLLDEAATKCDKTSWPYPIIRYLRREISAQDLLAAATDLDKKTEARTYLGLDLLLSGQRDEALTHLQWVKDNGNKDFAEYGFALAEIRRAESTAPAQP